MIKVTFMGAGSTIFCQERTRRHYDDAGVERGGDCVV